MKNYLIFSFLIFCFFSCSNSKTVINKTREEVQDEFDYPCALCDFLVNKKKIQIPKDRFISFDGLWIDETVSFDDRIMESNDGEQIVFFKDKTIKIYNHQEFSLLQQRSYCFIGKTKTQLRKLFKETDEVIGTKNGLYFSYFIGSVPESEKGDSTSFRIEEQRYIRFFNFSADSIYLGVKQDSMKLLDCIEKGK